MLLSSGNEKSTNKKQNKAIILITDAPRDTMSVGGRKVMISNIEQPDKCIKREKLKKNERGGRNVSIYTPSNMRQKFKGLALLRLLKSWRAKRRKRK